MFKRIPEISPENQYTGIKKAEEYAIAERASGVKYKYIMKKLDDLSFKGKYLEIGTRSGVLLANIAKRNNELEITSIENSKDIIELTKKYIKKKGINNKINYIIGGMDDVNVQKQLKEYNLIISSFSLHHWKEPENVINVLLQSLKENGKIFIHDLRRVWWMYIFPKWNCFFNSIRASYTKREIIKILRKYKINYKIEKVFPFFLNILIWK